MTFDPTAVQEAARRVALENAVKHGSLARAPAVAGRLLATTPELRAHAAELQSVVGPVVEAVNAMTPEARAAAWAAMAPPEPQPPKPGGPPPAKGPVYPPLPPLDGAEPGHVVMRFAPFPSGTLHIGHSRALYIHDEYRRRYQGKFLLVFDDTVGSEEKRPLAEAYELILKDMEAAGVAPDEVLYKSDRLLRHYAHLPKLLESGKAYVCTCPAELLREHRAHGEGCAHRDAPLDVQKDGWDGMLGGRYQQGEAVVRLKTDLKHPNPAFRDRVLFRISDMEHPRVGRKYRVWPLLEYSWAIDDVELGITHVIRGKDLVIEDLMETAIWDALGLQGPRFVHWGLLRVREAKLSKSKSMAEVMAGTYDGWADPRTWSFMSLRRRGIRPEALRSFALSFGLSLTDIEVPAETLYAENRHIIDPTSARRSFVPGPRQVHVDGWPSDLRTVPLANHPEIEAMGTRDVTVGPDVYIPGADLDKNRGKEVRLKDLANIQLPESPTGDPVSVPFTSRPNKPIPRLQWVSAPEAVQVTVLMPDGIKLHGMGEAALADVKEGEVYQLERFGFVRADEQDLDPSAPRRLVFAHP